MSVTPTPAFTQSPLLAQVQMGTANTNRDGSTGTYSSAISAGANGSLVDYIAFKAIVTTTPGTLRIFYSPDSGTTWRLLDEVATAGAVVGATSPGESQIWIPPGGVPLNLPSTGQLKFCPNNSETWNVFVHGGNL
jgi:hypothetical protein